MIDVVVVLPLLPVMQTFFAESYRPANSISETMLMPAHLQNGSSVQAEEQKI